MLIKDVDFKLIEMFEQTGSKITDLINMSVLLGKYMEEPENTLNSILNSIESEEEKKRVSEIIEGLSGEFTRAKALELGKSKIVSIIKDKKDQIVIDYLEIGNLFREPVETLFDNYNIILNTSVIKTIELRKDVYNSKQMLLDHARRKLPTVVVPMINNAESSKSVTEYISRLNDILTIMKNFDVSDIKNIFNVYLTRKEYIEDLIKKYSKEFKDEYINVEIVEKKLDTNEYVNGLINGDTIVEEGKDVMTILDDVISNMNSTLLSLKDNMDLLTKTIKNNNNERTLTTPIINKFIEDSVIPYSESVITTEEYMDKIAITTNLVKNSIRIDLTLVNSVCNKLHELNMLLNVYMVIYSVLDKITLHINIENTTLKVSGVNK